MKSLVCDDSSNLLLISRLINPIAQTSKMMYTKSTHFIRVVSSCYKLVEINESNLCNNLVI